MMSHRNQSRVAPVLLIGLVAVALICSCPPALLAETDMTSRLTNPDFESGLTGWTTGSDGTALHYNEAAAYETPQSGSLAYHVGPSSSGTHTASDASLDAANGHQEQASGRLAVWLPGGLGEPPKRLARL